MELIDVGLLLAGLLLVFFGAALSVYAVILLGFLIGAGGGYVFAPQLLGVAGAEGLGGLAAAIVVGGVLGAVLGYVALSFATAIPGFVVGAYLGLYAFAPLLGVGSVAQYGVALLGGIAGATLGFLFTKFALVFVTAFLGAALASGEVAIEHLRLARETFSIDPLLFDPLSSTPVLGLDIPVFGVLFVLGVLSQIGLFRLGWVARLASVVPGVGRVLRTNGG